MFDYVSVLNWNTAIQHKFAIPYHRSLLLLLLLLLLQLLLILFRCLRDSKSLRVTRTPPSILSDLNNVVWMVSICSFISKSSNPFINPLVPVPSASITIGITITFTFHSFFQFSVKVLVLIFIFAFFQFYPLISQNSKFHYSTGSLFLLTIIKSSRLNYHYYYYLRVIYTNVCLSAFTGLSFHLFSTSLGADLSAIATICITGSFMFQSLFNSMFNRIC